MIENGYYLSAYCAIDALSNELNLTLRHDQNLTLWKLENNTLNIIHHWELERRTGLKHHPTSFYCKEDFVQLVDGLLNEYDLNVDDLKAIIGMDENLINKDDQMAYHALCHLYSTLLSNTNDFYHEKILSLSLDGGPDAYVEKDVYRKAYFVGSYSVNGVIDFFPINSPGRIWTIARQYLGLEEGSLMALAYASESRTFEAFPSFSRIMYFDDFTKLDQEISKLVQTIFSYTKEDMGKKFNFYDDNFSEKDNKISMVMKIIQEKSIELVENTIDEAMERYNTNPSEVCLALSGGYSLNCPTNTHLMHKYGFKKQIMIPCTNDGGQAIGIGLKFFYDNVKPLNFKFEDAYYGDYCEKNISGILDEYPEFVQNVEKTMDYFVDDIKEFPIVWFDGRSEIGPRALGHRSILADSRTVEAKDKLNNIKQRQWWRPVAPIVLETACDEWFEKSFSTPYMLNNFVVREEKQHLVPAILHIDNTARVQTINESNGLLYDGVCKFKEKTGVPIICNTSLNDRGEPIINSLRQAINFALRKGIKTIYYDGYRIRLMNHESFPEKNPCVRDCELFLKKEQDDYRKYTNPYAITRDEYKYYTRTKYFINYDLHNEMDAKKLKKIVKKYIEFDNKRKESVQRLVANDENPK